MDDESQRSPEESSMDAADTLSSGGGTDELSRRGTEVSGGRPRGRQPSTIGDYRIVRQIGEGGMGVVYEAEQLHPRRPVALKVIRGGAFVSESQVRMFQREAQTLARLKHPNIASIYESGRTDDGQHFFSMELVRGEPLNAFFARRSEEARLTPDEIRYRISVLRRICDAVNYAHQRGVIHRDLKPSNILIHPAATSGVSSDSISQEIKILDFGLARITDADVAAPTVVTELGKIQGTLPYMSPEQLKGNPEEIDIRSDVYSLGVLLYELLTGKRPYDLRNMMVHQAAVVICEKPPRPLGKAWIGTRRLDPDLETIVMKALEKEPRRRYQSAAGLSEDLERYLDDQPILARPPSALYQLRKMVSRHRASFAFGAALLVLLAGFAVVMSVQAGRIARERDRANRGAEIANQVTRFLVDTFRVPDPGWSGGEKVTAREVLDRGAETIRFDLVDQPEVRARLMGTMAESYTNLGLYDQGMTLAYEAYRIRGQLATGDDAEAAGMLQLIANIQHSKGDYQEAERLARESLAARTRLFGERHEEVAAGLQQLAVTLKAQARWDEAEVAYREALSIRREVYGDRDTRTAATITSLAELLRLRGRLDEAESLHREALRLAREIHGELHPLVGDCLNNLALVVQAQERYPEAERLFRETLGLERRLYPDGHPSIAVAMNNLAALLKSMERYEQSEAMQREALDMRRRLLGDGHPLVASSLNNLAVVLQSQMKLDEAELHLREALGIVRSHLGEDHPHVGISLYNLGRLQYERQDWAAAEDSLRGALPIMERTLPEGSWRLGYARTMIGRSIQRGGRLREAEPWVVQGYEIVLNDRGKDDPRTRSALEVVVDYYEGSGRPDKAAEYRALIATAQE